MTVLACAAMGLRGFAIASSMYILVPNGNLWSFGSYRAFKVIVTTHEPRRCARSTTAAPGTNALDGSHLPSPI